MRKALIKFFDRIEDKVRSRLSHQAIFYAFVGGAATLLFWRGAWRIFDDIENLGGIFGFLLSPVVSLILSIVILLATGLFVSVFIGEMVIISGLKQEKKVFDKTESEIRGEGNLLMEIKSEMEKLTREISDIKGRIKKTEDYEQNQNSNS